MSGEERLLRDDVRVHWGPLNPDIASCHTHRCGPSLVASRDHFVMVSGDYLGV